MTVKRKFDMPIPADDIEVRKARCVLKATEREITPVWAVAFVGADYVRIWVHDGSLMHADYKKAFTKYLGMIEDYGRVWQWVTCDLQRLQDMAVSVQWPNGFSIRDQEKRVELAKMLTPVDGGRT